MSHTIKLRQWNQPKSKTCRRCGRVGTRSFYESPEGTECWHIDTCITRSRKAERKAEREAGQ